MTYSQTQVCSWNKESKVWGLPSADSEFRWRFSVVNGKTDSDPWELGRVSA
jgi:hypothetical protein